MDELIRMILMALVDAPDQVRVNRIRGANSLSLYEIKVAKADIGKIVGKQGRNAAALRTIAQAVSRKMNERSMIEILE